MTKFTQFKKDEYRVIEKYISLIKKDFDIVEAYDLFSSLVNAGIMEDSSESFYDWLIDEGCIEYIDPDVATKEHLGKDNYVWELGSGFPSLHMFNTFHSLAGRLQEKLPIHDLISLVETIDTVIPAKECGIDLVVNDFLWDINQRIVAGACGERDDEGIKEFLLLVRGIKFRRKLDGLIEKNGYTTVGVFDPEDGLPFVYTVGLSIKHGSELIVRAPIRTIALYDIISATAKKVIEGESITEPFTYGATLATGESMRFKAIEVTRESTENFVCSTRTDVFKTFQILIADKNNILPDEEGYDQEFTQPLFDKVT